MATLQLGSVGDDVSQWQGLLASAGFPVPVTGVFDDATKAATMAWQSAKGLASDGIVGPLSRAAMTGGATSVSTADLAGPSGGDLSIANVKGTFATKTTNRFRWLLLGVAERLGVNADWLAGVMASETGGTFDPAIKNSMGGATGLIQFMPSTAKVLGTTTDALAGMSAEDQLVYVEKYFKPHAGKMHSATDMYMATFMPAFVGRDPSFVIGRKDDDTPISGKLTLAQVYKYNPGFDHNNDGEITVGEVGATVEGILAKAAALPRIPVDPETPVTPSDLLSSDLGAVPKGGAIVAAVIAAGLGFFRLYFGRWPW